MQPVNWLKLFAGYMMSFVQFEAKADTLILRKLDFLFFSLRLGYHAEQA